VYARRNDARVLHAVLYDGVSVCVLPLARLPAWMSARISGGKVIMRRFARFALALLVLVAGGASAVTFVPCNPYDSTHCQTGPVSGARIAVYFHGYYPDTSNPIWLPTSYPPWSFCSDPTIGCVWGGVLFPIPNNPAPIWYGLAPPQSPPLPNYSDASVFTEYIQFDANGQPSASPPPIVINNVTDLQNIRNNLAGDYIVGSDIDASGFNFAAIGSEAAPFLGTLDGNGKTIRNLTVNSFDGGLFGGLGATGLIKNVNLSNVMVIGVSSGGGLVGSNLGGTVSNCSVSGTAGSTNGSGAGGLIGYMTSGTVSHSSSTASVGCSVTCGAGGLVGTNISGTIENSFASADILGNGFYVGGLVGNNGGVIKNSYATGAPFSYRGFAGGLVGGNYGTIFQSYASANVIAIYDYGGGYAGGLVGQNTGQIIQSYASGSVLGQFAGGLVGWLAYNGSGVSGSIQQSYSTASVLEQGFGGALNGAGGLVGISEAAAGSIDQTYAAGSVDSNGLSGGLIGVTVSPDPGSTLHSYWDIQVTGLNIATYGGSDIGAVGQTTAQLQSGSLPSGFDPAIWMATPGQYPILRWQAPPTPTITSFSPASGPVGSSVVVSGTNFGGALGTASLCGVSSTTILHWEDTAIAFIVPQLNAGQLCDLDIVGSAGSAKAASKYSVTLKTTISGRITNTAGDPIGGVQLSISGPALSTITTANNGRYSSPLLPSGTYTVTPDFSGYQFTTPGMPFTIENSFRLVFVPGVTNVSGIDFIGAPVFPLITKVNPDHGTIGTLVTVTGSGFGTYDSSISKLLFGSVSVDVQHIHSWSDVQIVADAPPNTQSVLVSVVTAEGKSNFVAFNYLNVTKTLGVVYTLGSPGGYTQDVYAILPALPSPTYSTSDVVRQEIFVNNPTKTWYAIWVSQYSGVTWLDDKHSSYYLLGPLDTISLGVADFGKKGTVTVLADNTLPTTACLPTCPTQQMLAAVALGGDAIFRAAFGSVMPSSLAQFFESGIDEAGGLASATFYGTPDYFNLGVSLAHVLTDHDGNSIVALTGSILNAVNSRPTQLLVDAYNVSVPPEAALSLPDLFWPILVYKTGLVASEAIETFILYPRQGKLTFTAAQH